MTEDTDIDQIVAGVVRCVVAMEQAYLNLLLELYMMGWISRSDLDCKLDEHRAYQENRLAELVGKV